MDLTAPINARQLEVLQWIADGCPEGVMKDSTYKTTAIALQGRRLVAVSRKGGEWRAVTAQTGDHYLRHGTYPDDMRASRQRLTAAVPPRAKAPRVAARPAAVSRKPAVTRTGGPTRGQTIEQQAEGLVARVIQAGGVLEIDTEKDEADYQRVCKAAKEAPNLPFGKQLRTRNTGAWWEDLCEIYFDEDFAVRTPPRPVPVPTHVAAYHPVVAAYRADAGHQEVSKDSLGRASRILQALAAEAVRRGHTVKTPEASAERYAGARVRSLPKGQLRIVIDGFTYRLRMREQSGKGGELLPYGHQRERLPYWQQARQTMFLPTGELRITVEEGYSRDGRQAEFRDSTRASLEERLPGVLRELEIRAAEDAWRRQEEERKAQEKQRRWERAMDHARRDFREARRAEVLRGQLADWQLGNDLDEYLAAIEASILTLTSVKEQSAAAAWLAWAKEYRQSINPLAKPLAMPPVPKPKPDELKPYLRGWSPYGPGT